MDFHRRPPLTTRQATTGPGMQTYFQKAQQRQKRAVVGQMNGIKRIPKDADHHICFWSDEELGGFREAIMRETRDAGYHMRFATHPHWQYIRSTVIDDKLTLMNTDRNQFLASAVFLVGARNSSAGVHTHARAHTLSKIVASNPSVTHPNSPRKGTMCNADAAGSSSSTSSTSSTSSEGCAGSPGSLGSPEGPLRRIAKKRVHFHRDEMRSIITKELRIALRKLVHLMSLPEHELAMVASLLVSIQREASQLQTELEDLLAADHGFAEEFLEGIGSSSPNLSHQEQTKNQSHCYKETSFFDAENATGSPLVATTHTVSISLQVPTSLNSASSPGAKSPQHKHTHSNTNPQSPVTLRV